MLEREQSLATRRSAAWRSIWLTLLTASVALAASLLGVNRSAAQVGQDEAPAGTAQDENVDKEAAASDPPMEAAATDADQLEVVRQALLDRAARLRAEWRLARGEVPEALLDLDAKIRGADSGPEIRELIAVLQEFQLQPRADKSRAPLVRQLEALERVFVEFDGEVPKELRALRAKLTNDRNGEAASSEVPQEGTADEEEPVVVIKRLQERLQGAVERRLAAEPDVGQPRKTAPAAGRANRGSSPERLADQGEGAVDVRGQPDDFSLHAGGLAQLDLIRLAEAYSDAMAEVEIAKARLAQVHETNDRNPDTLPATEVAIHEVRYLAAERKLKLLRAIASAALQAAKAELEASHDQHLSTQRLAEKGFATQQQVRASLARRTRIESTVKILELIVAE
ncbi:MAG: hypothetical protein WD847_15995 [Pirellulales bacterium]